jgi:hypothetical protein
MRHARFSSDANECALSLVVNAINSVAGLAREGRRCGGDHGVDASTRRNERWGILQVAVDQLHASLLERLALGRIGSSTDQRAHVMTGLTQPGTDV